MKSQGPEFFGVGAAIPGLTEVYAFVREHPQLHAPEAETHYFSSDRLDKGKEWYEEHFSGGDTGVRRGELASTYLHTAGVAPRIAREYPRAKLFAVIRNPLASIQLLYSEAVLGKSNPPTLEQFLERQPTLLEHFRYGRALVSFFSYYSPVDFLVLTYEDFIADPLASVLSIYKHLDLDPSFVPKSLRVPSEPKHPKLLRLARRLRITKVIDYIKAVQKQRRDRRLAPKVPLLPLSPRERSLLQKYYEKDVQQLSSLLHRDMMAEWDMAPLPEKSDVTSKKK